MSEKAPEAPPIVRLSYKKGDLIVKEGDYGVSIYKILEGKAGVFRDTGDGEVLIATLGTGDVFGERTFLNKGSQRRSASIRASEDMVVEAWHTSRLVREYQEMTPAIKYITDQILARCSRMDDLIVKLMAEARKEKALGDKAEPLASQRRYYRKPVDMPCDYRPEGASEKFSLRGRIKDISQNGLAVVVDQKDMAQVPHQKGDRFFIKAALPHKQDLELKAQVVAVQEKPSAEWVLMMSITDISAASRKALGFFLMP